MARIVVGYQRIERLPLSFEYLFEIGLGLYIVDTILKKLGYQLGYRHEMGVQNIFMIMLQK